MALFTLTSPSTARQVGDIELLYAINTHNVLPEPKEDWGVLDTASAGSSLFCTLFWRRVWSINIGQTSYDFENGSPSAGDSFGLAHYPIRGCTDKPYPFNATSNDSNTTGVPTSPTVTTDRDECELVRFMARAGGLAIDEVEGWAGGGGKWDLHNGEFGASIDQSVDINSERIATAGAVGTRVLNCEINTDDWVAFTTALLPRGIDEEKRTPIVADVNGQSDTNGTDPVVPVPLGIQAGDLLVLIVTTTEPTGATDTPAGYTEETELVHATAQLMTTVFWKIATTADESIDDVTVTYAGSTNDSSVVHFYRIVGADPTTPFHVTSIQEGEAGDAVAPDATPTIDRCLVIRYAARDSISSSSLPLGWENGALSNDGFLEANDTNDCQGYAASEQQLVAAAVGTENLETTGAADWIAATLVIAPLNTVMDNTRGIFCG